MLARRAASMAHAAAAAARGAAATQRPAWAWPLPRRCSCSCSSSSSSSSRRSSRRGRAPPVAPSRGFAGGKLAGGGRLPPTTAAQGGAARRLREDLAAQRENSARMFGYLAAVVLGMTGLTYASVPLYRLFCQATGYGGTVQTSRDTIEQVIAAYDRDPVPAEQLRPIRVSFNTDVASGLEWSFRPAQREVVATPGESTLAFFTVKNHSDRPLTGVSAYNVAPQKAGAYFHKIQCFCFEEQMLQPGEEVDMPVFFYIDPALATDRRLRGVSTLTLSYTFFKSGDARMPAAPDLGPAVAPNTGGAALAAASTPAR